MAVVVGVVAPDWVFLEGPDKGRSKRTKRPVALSGNAWMESATLALGTRGIAVGAHLDVLHAQITAGIHAKSRKRNPITIVRSEMLRLQKTIPIGELLCWHRKRAHRGDCVPIRRQETCNGSGTALGVIPSSGERAARSRRIIAR